MKKIYISLPIAHYDLEERRQFAQSVEDVLSHFYECVNPLKNGLPENADWREHMRVDIKNLLDCDAVCFCDDYRNSKGCHLEYTVSSRCGLEIMTLESQKLTIYENVKVNSERWLSLEDFKCEEWRDVVGWSGYYQVSNYGRVKSVGREIKRKAASQKVKERILVQTIGTTGYYTVGLTAPEKKRKRAKVHRLVAEAFILNPNTNECINHIDENKTNNILPNIEFCTYSYNLSYMGKIERGIMKRKTTHLQEVL